MAPVRPSIAKIQIDTDSLDQKIRLISETGTTRLAYSQDDVRGRAVVMDLMRQVGLAVSVDAAGNIVGRRHGKDQLPPIAFGSHVDTVRNGGHYDGILGVMAAIECVKSLQDSDYTTIHPLEVLVFANEEGQRFGALCGSRALVGAITPHDLAQADETGHTLAEAIRVIGGDPGQLAKIVRKPADIAAFIELHIEQGGTLDAAGIPIGIVEGISGISHTRVRITGAAAHSGTTTMELRKDALTAAAQLVILVQRAALERRCQVATVGQMNVLPNAVNVIPAEVTLTVEVRDMQSERIAAARKYLREHAEQIALNSRVKIEFSEDQPIESVPCSPLVQESIERACVNLGLNYQKLPSGAGHDAQIMAKLAPMGMIFVPSSEGISHSPLEFTSPEDCARGTQVLLQTILHLDETLSSAPRSHE
jgi:beta-ureidopropionase / N-carbamoyl-L-amino-acid hydrolase